MVKNKRTLQEQEPQGTKKKRMTLSSVITVNGYIKLYCENICASFEMPYTNIQYPNMWISAILNFYYLIVTIQSIMKILSTKINNVVCYYRC